MDFRFNGNKPKKVIFDGHNLKQIDVVKNGARATVWKSLTNLITLRSFTDSVVKNSIDSNGYFNSDSHQNSSWDYSHSYIKLTLPKGTYYIQAQGNPVSTNYYRGLCVVNSSNTRLLREFASDGNDVYAIYSFTLSAQTSIGILFKGYQGRARIMLSNESFTSGEFEQYQ